MEFCKRLAAVSLAALAVMLSAGCKKKTYEVYTNIPSGGYEITDSSYRAGETIVGYIPETREFPDVDTNGYTSRQNLWFSMQADAQLVLSTNFEAEGAWDKYTAFTAEISKTLDEVDKALSSTVQNSDIYKFNTADAGSVIEIRELTYKVLDTAKNVFEFTEGYYNPALYYNIQAYGFGGADNRPQNSSQLPSDETIAKYNELASHFSDIELSSEDGKYYVKKPAFTVEAGEQTLSMRLDLGGIGKGYAVDKIDELFDKYGYSYGYFNFGSSSMLVKSNLGYGEFNLHLTNPRSPSRDTYFMVNIRGEKLSTSGDNEQFYNIDGKRYCHVIDPTTGKPVSTGITSVTVIGGSAAEADALTTAIMAMGRERAVSFAEEKLKDRKVIFTCE